MTRGYQANKIREKLIDVLHESKTGLSSIEISEKLKVNRITMTKYLKVFAAEGLVKQKNMGSGNLWFIEEGINYLHFPDDYFQVKNKYGEYVLAGAIKEAHNILRNSIHSGASPIRLIIEVIVPTIESVQGSYDNGKIGKSEKNFLDGLILSSIHSITMVDEEIDQKKNAVVFSTDPQSFLLAHAASVAFQVGGWKVSQLGDMSAAIDVMFDIDLQRFLNKVWLKKQGIMIVVIFSSTEGPIKFFSEAVKSCKTKFGKALHLVLCSKLTKKAKVDFASDNIETVLQWCQTVYESSHL